MDTDRDRDVALLEVQEENRQLVKEFMKDKLGKRARRMMDGSGQRGDVGTEGVEGGYAGGQAPADIYGV